MTNVHMCMRHVTLLAVICCVKGLLADAQELIDTYLTELELINMSTNSQMYHRKQKICLIQQSMTYCVWSKGIHQTEKLGFWKTLFKSVYIAIKMQKNLFLQLQG